jgi:2-oxoisovalerate dehydrogenase E2 component (dihydrolipoyl transacylase)
MKIFKLPDLGEGLPDAEVNEWYVSVGDTVTTDQPLVSMETAKAVVDVPSPNDGVIKKLYGNPGDVIQTGKPLIEFESTEPVKEDSGTVVGNIEESGQTIEDDFVIGAVTHHTQRAKATPKVKALARKLGVDLKNIKGTGTHGLISAKDVENATDKPTLGEGFVPLRGVRRAMIHSMTQSHKEVVSVTIYDDADINAWHEGTDISARLIQAICDAVQIEPAINAWFDGKNNAVKQFDTVALGIAMDTKDGLFVPVINDAHKKSLEQLREKINAFKLSVNSREIPPEQLTGATITLSNFGNFAGRYASPIIVPPQVAIVGVGRLREEAKAIDGVIESRRIIPLSLSFDHRAATGGEATRFLGAVIQSLEKA